MLQMSHWSIWEALTPVLTFTHVAPQSMDLKRPPCPDPAGPALPYAPIQSVPVASIAEPIGHIAAGMGLMFSHWPPPASASAVQDRGGGGGGGGGGGASAASVAS